MPKKSPHAWQKSKINQQKSRMEEGKVIEQEICGESVGKGELIRYYSILLGGASLNSVRVRSLGERFA